MVFNLSANSYRIYKDHQIHEAKTKYLPKLIYPLNTSFLKCRPRNPIYFSCLFGKSQNRGGTGKMSNMEKAKNWKCRKLKYQENKIKKRVRLSRVSLTKKHSLITHKYIKMCTFTLSEFPSFCLNACFTSNHQTLQSIQGQTCHECINHDIHWTYWKVFDSHGSWTRNLSIKSRQPYPLEQGANPYWRLSTYFLFDYFYVQPSDFFSVH